MAQLKHVVEPFGEVNLYPAGAGRQRVTATVLLEPNREGTQTGIALDGSGSMAGAYGLDQGGPVSAIFRRAKPTNQVEPVARQVCAYLARKLDADGGTTAIYWATGPGGSHIEVIGDLTAEQAELQSFGPPENLGTGTQLLPAVKYFVERFTDAPWGFYVFITDGELHDLAEVKDYTIRLARDIHAGKRSPLKMVLIGIGSDINEQQMEELDDLDTRTPVDIWDHKIAAEMHSLTQIFAEVVSDHARIAETGRILDHTGKVLREYPHGVPARLEFETPLGVPYFTLEVNGNRLHQGLSDAANVPASELADSDTLDALPVEDVDDAVANAGTAAEADPFPEVKLELDKGMPDFELKFEKDEPQ